MAVTMASNVIVIAKFGDHTDTIRLVQLKRPQALIITLHSKRSALTRQRFDSINATSRVHPTKKSWQQVGHLLRMLQH
jgi:hypothetical protein